MGQESLPNQPTITAPEQDEKARAEYAKLTAEISKLAEETKRLRSENSTIGSVARILWPLVSGLLTIALSLMALTISRQSQSFTAEQEKRKVFFSALQMATDSKAGQDARIAGIWTLVDYWHDPQYSETVANALAAVLATEPEGENPKDLTRVQRLRLAAATVIGHAIEENTANQEASRLRKLLYGDGPSGVIGAVGRYNQDLGGLRESMLDKHQDTSSVDLSLQATREAIRQNWENLEFGMFAGHNLIGIDLYSAHAKGAYFGGAVLAYANLCGADLSKANFEHAKLTAANLSDANLDSSLGWETADLKQANINNVKNPPPAFIAAASASGLFIGAVNLPTAKWLEDMKASHTVPPFAVYTNCK